jgi:hypothetical protein
MSKETVRITLRLCPIEDEELLEDLSFFVGTVKTSRIRRLLRAGLQVVNNRSDPEAAQRNRNTILERTEEELNDNPLEAPWFDPSAFQFGGTTQ